MLHDVGGLVYIDGANMNAILGITRPGDFGGDMMHYNVHKTFTGPHGAGGPGAGPIAVRDFLADYLPGPVVIERRRQDGYRLTTPAKSIGRMRSVLRQRRHPAAGLLLPANAGRRRSARRLGEGGAQCELPQVDPSTDVSACPARRTLHARVRRLGQADQAGARHLGDGHRQAAARLMVFMLRRSIFRWMFPKP